MTNKSKNKVKLFPPYVILHNKLKALFEGDSDITFSKLNDRKKSVTIYCKNARKLAALQTALDVEKFESVGFHVFFKYNGDNNEQADFVRDLFTGNPHFSRAYVAHDAGNPKQPVTICYFKDETIQYSADSRFVPDGYETVLAEQLIPDLFRPEVRRMKYITEEKQDYQASNAYPGCGVVCPCETPCSEPCNKN